MQVPMGGTDQNTMQMSNEQNPQGGGLAVSGFGIAQLSAESLLYISRVCNCCACTRLILLVSYGLV